MLPMSSRMLPVLFSATADGLRAARVSQEERPEPCSLAPPASEPRPPPSLAPPSGPAPPPSPRGAPHLPRALPVFLPYLLLYRLQRCGQARAGLLQLLPRAVPGRGAVGGNGGGSGGGGPRGLGGHE